MTFLLDSRAGSWELASLEPVRSLLPLCSACRGTGTNCQPCRGTGRQLSRITTSFGEGGPDVLICGNGPAGPILIAIEVKEVRDLIQSADTGRLQAEGEGQLQAMLADYQQSWLLWYGQVRRGDNGHLEEPGGRGDNGRCLWRPFTRNPGRDTGAVRNSYLDQMLLAVAAMGVHVAHVSTKRDAARWLGELYTYWSKLYDEHSFTRTFKDVPRFPKVIKGTSQEQIERARRIADRYPGLGMERALAAARHFGSVREMANATEKEWQEVPGIGKVIAAAVVKGFNS